MAKAKTPGGPKPVTRGFRPGKGPSTPAAPSTVTIDAPAPAKKKTSLPQFASQVRAEMRKIVWPSRKETWITSVMVFIMVLLASAFFWIVDTGLGLVSRYILAIGQ
jgi:preprotein translocase subunit SecE